MIFKKHRPPAGAIPGTLAISEIAQPTRIHIMQFNDASLIEQEVTVSDVPKFLSDKTITWIDVHGLKDESVLRQLADQFSIHPLALEDVVHTPQRPKTETYDNHLFVITRMIFMNGAPTASTEQLSVFIGQNYVLSFQGHSTGTLNPVRDRIQTGKGSIRKAGADYVGYAILDTVIDKYYPVLEQYGEQLESTERQTIENPTNKTLQQIYRIKRELLDVRRSVWPQRDVMSSLIREETPFISRSVKVYLRDCYDHIIQLMDVVDTYREMSSNLMDIYLTTLSNKTNEVMKVLTIMASIFIPLTFIVGIYGMNFEYMPELTWKWGYPAVWAVMLTVAGLLLHNFKHRGWLVRDSKPPKSGPSTRSTQRGLPPKSQ
ncbi:MAG: magnesium and cobalt transport protein CorA [Deltaproteobacteria bacterium CG11_big_fil_rev_8_21_14_0_20_47_16]|nr:MAG: magnesium and cobalt transport protein CorA [Deltaproteobacteria bacterium CG11_big_fil_rev_8_21_14_0_20_47_16]